MAKEEARFVSNHESFAKVLGREPTIRMCVEDESQPWAHEAGVYIPSTGDLFITSNRLTGPGGEPKIAITRVNIAKEPFVREEIDCGIIMANGGVNYKNGVLFCSQGTKETPSGLWHMEVEAPYKTTLVVDGFHGRQFNSPNDVVVHNDGSIWFTDPIYGFEQGFRTSPQLPNQVYRYDPRSKSIRAMADGFGRPNGISFSPDQTTVYITDTDFIHGDGTTDSCRPATIYAFDVIYRSEQPFLANRRLFAMADNGIPDGIKCDKSGNVYSGCGDGIHVWSPGGVLLGKIVIPGGVANFCFCRRGEILAMNETRLWQIKLAPTAIGSLLKL
ncbi:calcium-dependent phosphotriesterase [Thozetella sp. PMI_491]|nr:calcium-dependent phosphotriesterase [Thozetella sp. PMI_491]